MAAEGPRRCRASFSRRQFLKLLAASGAGLAGAYGYARGLEPGWLTVDKVTLPLRKTAGEAPLRIVQLSDLHVSSRETMGHAVAAVELALAQAPDLLVLTGDFVTVFLPMPDAAEYAAVLAPLAARCPVYAILGNHDGPARGRIAAYVNRVLHQAGALPLLNKTVHIDVRGRPLLLSGLGDLWSNECRPERCLFPLGEGDAERPTHILLSHNPDSKDLAQFYDWDLMIAGHTHGGQVRLPLIGAPVLPVDDRRFAEGLHRFQARHIYVSRGIGNLHGVRFNCRPWVSVLEV